MTEWIGGQDAADVLGVSRQRVYQVAHQTLYTDWPIRSQQVVTQGERPLWLYHRGDCVARREALDKLGR